MTEQDSHQNRILVPYGSLVLIHRGAPHCVAPGGLQGHPEDATLWIRLTMKSTREGAQDG
ncbi:hypothetical protein GCM10027456_03560 [Kineosporia babensis]